MAKKQKSFFEKLTEINASHDESKKEKNIKNQRFSNKKIWFTLGTLGAIIITAISVPLIINTSVVNLQTARPDESTIITFVDPIGNKILVPVKEVTRVINNEQHVNANKLSEAYKKAVFFLYEKEQKASITFQRVWNLSRSVGEQERDNLALKPISEVRAVQQSKIDDIKRNLQNTFGIENWRAEFQKEIAKDENGKSNTEEEAVEFLTFKELEKDALRSFELESSAQTLFTNTTQINRTATADIFDIDENGNRRVDESKNPIILFRQGEKVFPKFVENENFFSSGISDRVFTLKTRSFQENKWDVGIFIDEYFNKNTPYTISNFTIPGTAQATLTSPWTVNKQQFTNFALYSVIDNQVIQNGSLISRFKNLEDYVLKTDEATTKEKAIYENYLNVLAIDPENIKNNLGSTGIVSLVSLFNQKDQVQVAMSLLSSLFETDGAKLPTLDLSKLFVINYDANTKTQIDKLLEEAKKIENGSEIKGTDTVAKNSALNKMSDLISQVNIIIQRYLTQLSDANFNDLVGVVYRDNIVKTVSNRQYTSFIYNVQGSLDTKAVLTPAGITLVKNKKIANKEEFLKLIKSDLLNLSQGSPAYFKAVEAINVDTKNQNIVVQTLFQDEEFKTYLKNNVNINSENRNTKYTDQDITELSNIATSVVVGSQTNAAYTGMQKVTEWLKSAINTNASYNFTLKDGAFYIDFNKSVPNSLSTQPAKDTILNRIFIDFKIPSGGTN